MTLFRRRDAERERLVLVTTEPVPGEAFVYGTAVRVRASAR